MPKFSCFSFSLACLCLPAIASAQAPAKDPPPTLTPPAEPSAPPAAAAQPERGDPTAPPSVPGRESVPQPSAAERAPESTASAALPEGDESIASTNPAEPSEPAEPSFPVLTFHARIMTGFEVQREHPGGDQPRTDETQAELFLEQAVIEAEAQLSKRIDLELGFNLRNQSIRDAFINYRVEDALQFRVGRFKRPFSRLELRTRGKLPFRDRGLFNALVLTEHGFAGRSLGAMIWGKPNDQLRYSLAAASPTAIGSGIEGVDLIARVVYEPLPMLSLGINGVHKWSERFADADALSVTALGADARFEAGPLDVWIEFDAAQNPAPPAAPGDTDSSRTPWALGFIGWAEYAFKLSKKWSIAPVVVFEWLDTDTEYSQDERIRAVAGLSWNYQKNSLRVMPQVEIIRPIGGASARGAVASETYYLLVSSEI